MTSRLILSARDHILINISDIRAAEMWGRGIQYSDGDSLMFGGCTIEFSNAFQASVSLTCPSINLQISSRHETEIYLNAVDPESLVYRFKQIGVAAAAKSERKIIDEAAVGTTKLYKLCATLLVGKVTFHFQSSRISTKTLEALGLQPIKEVEEASYKGRILGKMAKAK